MKVFISVERWICRGGISTAIESNDERFWQPWDKTLGVIELVLGWLKCTD